MLVHERIQRCLLVECQLAIEVFVNSALQLLGASISRIRTPRIVQTRVACTCIRQTPEENHISGSVFLH